MEKYLINTWNNITKILFVPSRRTNISVQTAASYHETVHKLALGKAVLPVLLFSSGSILPPVLHTHFHLSSR